MYYTNITSLMDSNTCVGCHLLAFYKYTLCPKPVCDFNPSHLSNPLQWFKSDYTPHPVLSSARFGEPRPLCHHQNIPVWCGAVEVVVLLTNNNKMGCFNDPAWKVCVWWGGGGVADTNFEKFVCGGVADTNYLYPARWGWINTIGLY